MNRYSRNIQVIGSGGQKRLSEASVFIIGCGALGGQVAMLLAGAGVGRIGLADFDTIDLTNLQRQLFFAESQTGESKLKILASRIRALNSEIRIDPYPLMLTKSNAGGILRDYDFIVDATDTPVSKYAFDEVCRELGKPHCIGGVSGWRGQVMSVRGKRGEADPPPPGLSSLFPPPEADPEMLPCRLEGVIGAAASLIASVEAGEVIKYFTGEEGMLYGKAFVMDMGRGMYQVIDFA